MCSNLIDLPVAGDIFLESEGAEYKVVILFSCQVIGSSIEEKKVLGNITFNFIKIQLWSLNCSRTFSTSVCLFEPGILHSDKFSVEAQIKTEMI